MDVVLYGLYAVLAISILIPLIASREEASPRPVIALSYIAVSIYILSMTVLLYNVGGGSVEYYNGLLLHDGFSALMSLGAGVIALITLMAASIKPAVWGTHPAYYSLLPLSLFGIFFLAGAADLLVVLAAWLLVSVISYVIIALPDDRDSARAAARYIYLGAVATLLLGIWIAGTVASASEIGFDSLRIAPSTRTSLSGMALVFLVAALGFKLGLVPFHWWLPSVYGRADGRAVAVVAGVVKLGFIALVTRIVYMASQRPLGFETLASGDLIAGVLAALSIATMTYGNIAALTPRNVQSILAYSSIAHVGYILAGLAALAYYNTFNPQMARIALVGVALQSIAYGLSKSPLFTLASEAGRDISDWRGIYAASRSAGTGTVILLLSLLGLPPLLGFWGKLYLFIAAAGYSIILVLIALVNSGISSAYYIRIVREVLTGGGEAGISEEAKAALAIAGILTVLLGLAAPIITGII